jgi:hypothetical protein
MTEARTQTPSQIGIANAEAAFDQVRDFSSLADAIASYFENIQDTLSESGILTDAAFLEAEKAFDDRVRLLTSRAVDRSAI